MVFNHKVSTKQYSLSIVVVVVFDLVSVFL